MRIYIAGPITGVPDYAERFAEAAKKIEGMGAGHVAVNPALDGTGGGKSWHYYARRALLLMLTCDAVLFLDGWLKSKGARFERDVADVLGMTTFADVYALELLDDSIAPAPLGDDVEAPVEWALRFEDGELEEYGREEQEVREDFARYAPNKDVSIGYAKELLRRAVITIRYPWEVVERRDADADKTP